VIKETKDNILGK